MRVERSVATIAGIAAAAYAALAPAPAWGSLDQPTAAPYQSVERSPAQRVFEWINQGTPRAGGRYHIRSIKDGDLSLLVFYDQSAPGTFRVRARQNGGNAQDFTYTIFGDQFWPEQEQLSSTADDYLRMVSETAGAIPLEKEREQAKTRRPVMATR